MAKQYDEESGGTSWHVVFFDSNEVKPDIVSRYFDEEITPELAEKTAWANGYDCFEIVRTQTEIKR